MIIVFVRTVVIYILVVFALRMMGKRQLGELQPSELVVTFLVSNLATMSIEDNNVPMLGTIIPIFTLVSCEITLSYIILKSGIAQRIITGNAKIVIRDGTVDQKELRHLRWTIEDLLEQLRIGGIFDINEVALAIIETSGTVSAYQNFRSRPLTADTRDKPNGEDFPPALLISDGRIDPVAMSYCGVDRKWVEDSLKHKRLDLREVFMMTCDKKLNYTITKKD